MSHLLAYILDGMVQNDASSCLMTGSKMKLNDALF